ncbi:MAG: hypothetical protein JSW67_02460, partial [Candidatus Latescibacterota bacterium]
LRHQITLPLAGAAAVVMRRRAWAHLGYLNEHQLARDLFDWSGKTLRNLAALDDTLRKFPALARALTGTDGGRPIGRCAARRIGQVATPDTMETWIERARTLSVRALEEQIRDATKTAAGARNATATDAHDEKVLFRMQLPPEARMAHDEVADLHRAFAGHDATPASFLEDLLAEIAASGLWAPDPSGSSPGRFPPARRGTRKRAVSGRTAPTTEACLSEAATEDEWPTSTTEGRLATRLLKGFDADLRDLTRIVRQLQATERDRGHESEAPSGVPRGHLHKVREVVRILRNLVRAENQIEMRMGSLLLEQHERRAWSAFRCHSLGDYAEQRLGWSSASADRRVDVARALRRLPVVRRAYESGRLTLAQTEWIARATRKTTLSEPEQREWVEHAAPVSIKRLRDEKRILARNRLEHRAAVARAVTLQHGRDAGAPAKGAAVVRPLAGPTRVPSANCFPTPPDDATWLRSLARVPGQARNRLFDLEGALLERALLRGAMLEESVPFSMPESLAHDFLSCLTTLRTRVCREALASRSAAEEARALLSVRIAV